MVPESLRIIHRPEEIEARIVPGNWEGDLIKGAFNRPCCMALPTLLGKFFLIDRAQLMPHKLNDAWRHKFKKKRYQISNWPQYNESLRQRGDVTVWLSPEVEAAWRAERRKTRGGAPRPFG